MDNALRNHLREAGQQHLIQHADALTGGDRKSFESQLAEQDWATLAAWIREYVLQPDTESLPHDIQPAPYYPMAPETPEQTELYERAEQRAVELLRNGEVACFTVAGGQGTRLGYDAPKGTYPIAPLSGNSLFQLFAQSILRAQEKYGAEFLWCIMTSPMNHDATCDFFEDNDCFGLDPDQLLFFSQGTLPAVGFDGKVLLGDQGKLALSPNGHGGSLLAMRDSGALDTMRERGVRHISYWQVDNPLVHILDPLFLGLHELTGSEMSSRSLTKTGPFEKLGNFSMIDGKLGIVEYSDMPDELAQSTDEHGRLRFRAGSPAIHAFRREFVERITAGQLQLPVHRARKKVPCLTADGTVCKPEEPNGIKFEMFVFDALPLADSPLILEADRYEQFAPVKNPTGVDSVQSCRDLLNRRTAKWLEQAGINVPRTADGAPDCIIELSPLRFLDPQDVAEARNSLRSPDRGEEVCFA